MTVPESITTDAGRALWGDVMGDYELEGHHLRLLEQACLQLDRAEGFRDQIKQYGVVFDDRFGQPKTHPAVDGERNAHLAVARLLRELCLDYDTPEQAADFRKPRLAQTGS
ncbi:MAG: hypothetical protein MPJ50_15715 [Pirellulales bacterium]|nr:hypothetical protein [Pirellulales bacterium]